MLCVCVLELRRTNIKIDSRRDVNLLYLEKNLVGHELYTKRFEVVGAERHLDVICKSQICLRLESIAWVDLDFGIPFAFESVLPNIQALILEILVEEAFRTSPEKVSCLQCFPSVAKGGETKSQPREDAVIGH